MGKLGAIDWEKVELSCLKITREKSKDLIILCYMCFLYLRQDKWESFADVFDGMTQLAARNWAGLFPDRPRGKQLAMKWLAEARFNDTLAEKKATETDHSHFERLIASLTTLKGILEKEFPDGSPFPTGIMSFAQKWEKAIKPKPKVEQPATVASTSPLGGAPAAAEAMDTPKQAQMAARKAAMFLIEKEPQRPMGYRLSRALRWDLLDKAPPVQNGQTQLPPPAPEQRTYFQNLMSKADWQAALPAAEKAFTAGANHAWIDLQRISAAACAGMGAAYAEVRSAICFETALLLRRIPEMTTLVFSDGAPFCDAATKDWISAEVNMVFSSGGGGSNPTEAGGAAEGLDKEKKEANALAAAGKLDGAITLVQTAIRQSGNERDNFRRVLLLSNLLLSAKRPDIAVSMLESLDEKVDMYHLDRWDPDLAVEAWTQMIRAYRVIAPTKPQNIQNVLFEKQNSILSKLSRTNPMSAFQMNP
jgi:type VI secretion system protein VasJ